MTPKHMYFQTHNGLYSNHMKITFFYDWHILSFSVCFVAVVDDVTATVVGSELKVKRVTDNV